MTVGIKTIGDKKLMRKFKKMEEKVQRKIARESIKEGGKIVLQDSRSLSTGKIRASLHMRTRSNKREATATIQTRGREFFNIPEGDKFYYPAVVEYGAPAHVIKKAFGFKKVKHPGFKSKSYLRRAIERKRDQAVRKAGSVFKQKIIAAGKS